MNMVTNYGKAKLYRRFIAFLLCLCSIASLLPATVLPVLALGDDAEVYITRDGQRLEELSIAQSDRVTVKAEISGFSTSRFQWQILADQKESLWVDIYDMMGEEAEISYALISSVLDGSDSAYVRCMAITPEATVYSQPLCVTVMATPPTKIEAVLRAPAKAPAPLAAPPEEEPEYVHITVNYLSADDPDKSVFTSYVAKITKDTPYSQVVHSPTQIGFAPFFSGTSGDTDPNNAAYSADVVSVNYTPGDGDLTYNVFYKTIDVPYSVRYYFQNVNDDGYTPNAAISFNGMAKTGTIVQDETLTQPVYDYFGVAEGEDYGFTSLYHYPESVAADGSTVFECYYDRNYYLIKFDLDGGYGVEPIYARFGSHFVVTPPSKAGFVFKGWDTISTYTYDVYTTVNGREKKIGSATLSSDEYAEKGSPSTFIGTYTAGGKEYPNAIFRFSDAEGDGTPDKPEDRSRTPLVFNGEVDASAANYKAIWETQETDVTIVYWRENANDTKFSYWGAYHTTAMSNSLLNGENYKNNFAAAGITSETQYFTYLYADENVRVMGDGSTVVNVYYSRNHYTVFFDGVNTKCELDEHTHSNEDCYEYLCTAHAHTHTCYGCGIEEVPHTDLCCALENHAHDASCYAQCATPEHTHDGASCSYDCGITEHTHGDGNCVIDCGKTEHTHGDGNCVIGCGKIEHTHSDACINCAHVHTAACYGVTDAGTADVPGSWDSRYDSKDFMTQMGLESGCVYYYDDRQAIGATDHYILYLDGLYYDLSQSQYNAMKGTQVGSRTQFPGGGALSRDYGEKYRIKLVSCTHTTHDDSCYNCNGTGAKIEEHTHTNACCTVPEHTHTNACCTVPEHTHTDACCSKVVHTHTDACKFLCGKVEHTHTDTCCDIPEHKHTGACYTVGGTYNNRYALSLGSGTIPSWTNKQSTTLNGVTLWYDSSATTANRYLYVQIGDMYYRLNYNGSTGVTYSNRGYVGNLSLTLKCGNTEHTHGDGKCNLACVGYEHTHEDSCYACGKVTHNHATDPCDYSACQDPTHHVHDEDCLICGMTSEHTHDENCPKLLICHTPEHTHTATCNTANTARYHYGIVAKYDENIYDMWPIWTDYTQTDNDLFNAYNTQRFTGYAYNGGSTNYATRRQTLVADMIDTTDGISVATAQFSNNAYLNYANYYFESFNQSGPATATHKLYNGVYYDLDESKYTQTYYTSSSNTTLNAKPITGMQEGVTEKTTTDRSNDTTNLYYRRNIYRLDFKNYDNRTISGMTYDVMYEQPLSSVAAVNEALNTVPPYPSSLEPNAYEFAGWYTTEGRYDGSEYQDGDIMPAGPLTLFAKWVPVTHTVRFFETYDIMREYERTVAAGAPDESLVYKKASMPDAEYTRLVEHGSFVGSLPNPDKKQITNHNGSVVEYDFGGWFSVDNEQKKAFTPMDSPITRDTNVYAEWGTHAAQPYAVYYIDHEYETDSAWLDLLGEPTESYRWKDKTVVNGTQTRRYLCLEDKGTYRWFHEIADMTRGYAYQGTTRTFAAKAGETLRQLYTEPDVDYNLGYYPTPASHSITMAYEEDSLDPVNNVFAFKYVHVDEVDYTVRYLDAINPDPAHPLRQEKHITSNNAVVAERFIPIVGYVPDAFYKQCILAVVEDPANPGTYISSPDNVINFYYKENDTSARYTVHFMLQKPDTAPLTDADFNITFETDEDSESYGTYYYSDKFEESGSRIDGVNDKDTETEIKPITFAGFNMLTSRAEYSDGMAPVETAPYADGKYTITPVLEGTDLFIFYERLKYPYKVYYLKYQTPVSTADLATYTTKDVARGVLADTKGLDGLSMATYGTTYTENAPDIDDYVCVSAKTIEKAITPVAESNYIIFFYVPEQYTVQYVVAGGVGGEVSTTIETSTIDTMIGSTALPDPGYELEGWYVNPECTIPATFNETTNPDGKGTTYTDNTMGTQATGKDGVYVMPKTTRLIPNGQEGADTNIFYAKFRALNTDLTIVRENSGNEGRGDQVFVYEVKNKETNETYYVSVTGNDSVTIHGLPLGEYTVTQMNDWSHRFADGAQDVELEDIDGETVTFGDAAVNKSWLNANGKVAVNKKG